MTERFNDSFANYIKVMRKRVNISSKELARMLDKGDAYISQIENGRNKKPEYKTAFNLLKILKVDEDKIENILASFEILSPERIKEEQEANWREMEEAYWRDQEEKAQDPEYQQHLLDRQIEQYEQEQEWLANTEKELNKKNIEIKNQLDSLLNRNLDTFENVITNLHSVVTSMSVNKEDYNFFTNLFKHDLTEFNVESKKAIINFIIEEYKKAHKYNGGWGEAIF